MPWWICAVGINADGVTLVCAGRYYTRYGACGVAPLTPILARG
jgi:hypothetical protein